MIGENNSTLERKSRFMFGSIFCLVPSALFSVWSVSQTILALAIVGFRPPTGLMDWLQVISTFGGPCALIFVLRWLTHVINGGPMKIGSSFFLMAIMGGLSTLYVYMAFGVAFSLVLSLPIVAMIVRVALLHETFECPGREQRGQRHFYRRDKR